MANVLFIKANNRPKEQAVSVQLYHSFLDSYRASHPEDTITELDLFEAELPYMDAVMLAGIFKSSKGMELTAEEQKAADTANQYLEQFLAADKVVFGFPLWNLTVPAVLHTYMDYLNRAGKTFRYTPEGPVGLASDKKVALLNARGGDYTDPGRASSEMAVNFMKKTMELFGIRNLTTVIVEGHNQKPDQSASLIQAGVKEAAEVARKF